MPALLTFWGLFLTYAISPFAVFAFLNRLFGSEATRSPRFLAACLGLGPLVLSGMLLSLLAAFPGRPYSLHLWTVSGLMALLLAISERSGLECARNAGLGFLRLLSEGSEALRRWRSNWPSFLLLAAAFSALAALCVVSLTLPPSGADALMSLSLARDGYGAAELSQDVSPYGGLLIWSYMFQDSAAEAGAAKFVCPAFAIYASLLALALPLRSLFERCAALCLVVAAVFPHALLLDVSSLRIYSLLLLLFLALSFAKGARLFVCVLALLAGLSLLRFCQFAQGPFDSRLYLLGAFVAAALAARCLGGHLKTAVILLLALALFIPLGRLALSKASEFPLAWTFPALPEMAIVDNSSNGRFALFACVHSSMPPEGSILTPFPWDFAYYAPGRLCIGLDSGLNPFSSSTAARSPLPLQGVDYLCLPPPSADARPDVRRLESIASDPEAADLLFERGSWRIFKLRPNP